MALNTGRSGQPVQNPGGRLGTGAPNSSAAWDLMSSILATVAEIGARSRPRGTAPSMKPAMPFTITSAWYSPPLGNGPLPTMVVLMSAFRSMALNACSR